MFLTDQNIFIHGKLSGMTRRKASMLVRKAGGTIVAKLDESVNIVVLGGNDSPQLDFDEITREKFEQGKFQTLSETDFLALLENSDDSVSLHSLYTSAMLAELVQVPSNMIRLWERRGWLTAKATVGKLSYYDEIETVVAKRLAKLHQRGASSEGIAKKLDSLKIQFPEMKRPLAELEIVIHGKRIEILKDGILVDAVGQKLFTFDEVSEEYLGNAADETWFGKALEPAFARPDEYPADKESLCEWAIKLEEQGQLAESLDCYRAALAAGGSDAVSCFHIAGLLYRLGDPAAARERYLMAIELDEDFVEARANLGALFAEQGELELAVSAFEGALDFHDGYADVHFQLGMTLLKLGKNEEARKHLEIFLELTPNNPWADRARDILNPQEKQS